MGDILRYRKVKPRKTRKPQKPRRMTPEVLTELVQNHMSCVKDYQSGTCPLLMSIRALTWEINQFCGLANEEDKGFKRYSEMQAARPLHQVFVNYMQEEEGEDSGEL